MKPLKHIFPLAMMAALIACSPDNSEPCYPGQGEVEVPAVTLTMVDHQATPATRALYSHLWTIGYHGFMFGHHEDLMYGRNWEYTPGGSDTKDVCGDYPGVYGMEIGDIIDDRASQDSFDRHLTTVRQARQLGMAIVAVAHLNNPLTGGDAWDNTNDQTVAQILTPGSDAQTTFNSWLDRLATFANALTDEQGQLIPFVLRIFHEHTETWSWWGTRCTTEQQFIDLWQYTVKYLRDTRGVHSIIYALCPQMDRQKTEEDFLFRWPGDDYVDFIGMDCYQGLNPTVFAANIKAISRVSQQKRKPCGVTETGVEGFDKADYWTTQILTPATGRQLSMVVTWRNKFVGGNTDDNHFFSVFPGHPSVKDFMKFYRSKVTFFAADLPDLYTQDEKVSFDF